MRVIPAINCTDLQCAKRRWEAIAEMGCAWVHVDVVDGKFAPVTTWNNPQELDSKFEIQNSKLNVEVHLMVEDPCAHAESWLRVGAQRLIVHVESFRGAEDNSFHSLLGLCAEYGAELMVAVKPDTEVSELIPFLSYVLAVQCLAVAPGFSGQACEEKVFEKVRFLREYSPDLTIEVDGGINPETASLAKKAGADIVVSASYLFSSANPSKAYRELKKIAEGG